MTSLDKVRFIFSVTTGRSGSNFITEALSCLQNVVSVHEPKPRYDRVMRIVQHYPNVASQFLIEKKLPAIERQVKAGDIYFESSHLISKGFLEPWLSIDNLPTPDLICLDRPLREISLSFNQLNSIPGRTLNGLTYLLSPQDPNTLTTLKDLSQYNDYQLCYWYCLETEARKDKYQKLIESKGGKVARVSVNTIKQLDAFNSFRESLNLPGFSLLGQRKFLKLANQRVNAKSEKKSALAYDENQLMDWEKQVEENLTLRNPSK
ncbi:hypothetical protein [Pleionea sediminis]|uniref:hypothetical protein n=1 Tax=Pleionea sediminis TaxID=2569479 RepID=UPI0011868C20|nr:hypothetical protein [Pleionea sediminis]